MTLDSIIHANLSRYLPADLMEELPDPAALTTAIRRLNSLHQSLSSFLPQYIADNESLYNEHYGSLRPGTFMFADVSGFTALSEKLQRQDPREGAEIMTEVINGFFATMLEILAKSNGQLLKFAGDALLTFFPAASGSDESPQAIRTGLRMQRAMAASFQPIQHSELTRLFGDHNLELSMSIGISRGNLFEAVVGSTVQRDHIIQGDLPGQAMRAEEAGERDDVIVDAELQAAYSSLFETVPTAIEGFYRVVDNFGDELGDYEFVVPSRRRAQVSALFDFDEENLLDDLRRNLERVDGIARFVAEAVVDKLTERVDTIEAANRHATVIFMYFSGFEDLLKQWGEQHLPLLISLLERYYNLMQRVIANNGGTLTRTDPYRRGVKMLITFGAPTAHPDDPERAVATALEMNRQLGLFNARLRDELPDELQRWPFITQRIGIAYGSALAGLVGWRARREYTVMGDDVNLAARLMAKGEMGQILISKRVWKQVNPHFETDTLEPFTLKGKSRLIEAYLVKSSTISPLSVPTTSSTPFSGRDLQLLSLTYALQQAKGPRRQQAWALVGEAGVGKTRMALQVAQAAEDSHFVIAWANCQFRHTESKPVWGALIFQLLQLSEAKSVQAQHRLLGVRLNELGLADLEGVLSQEAFGTTEVQLEQTVSVEKVLPQTSDSKPASGPNIFDLAENKGGLDKSGIFGAMSALVSEDSPGAPIEHQLYDRLRQQVSLPDAIVRFIQAFSEHTPTLLVIDDIHRAEPKVLESLRQVIEDITSARLMVVVTYEPDEALDLTVRRSVKVTDLPQGEALMMAARFLGVNDVGPRLGKLIWERTRGRPLFIEALLQLLQQGDYLESQAGNKIEIKPGMAPETLPDNVRQLILSNFDSLTPEEQTVLQVAAVLGDVFSIETLATVGEIKDRERVQTLLDNLTQAQIVDLQTDGTYCFRHGLTQTVVYETLNRMQRQQMHQAAAEYLSGLPSERYLLDVVYHLVKAGRVMRATQLIEDGADEAIGSNRLDRAVDLYTHALEIFPHDEGMRVQLERLKQMKMDEESGNVMAVPSSPSPEKVTRSPNAMRTIGVSQIFDLLSKIEAPERSLVLTQPVEDSAADQPELFPAAGPQDIQMVSAQQPGQTSPPDAEWTCPHCGALPGDHIKAGRNRSGSQRYRCKHCGHTHTPHTA